MDKLDEMIEEALATEDREIWEASGELGYFAQAFGIFRGRQGWVAWVVMITQLALFVAGVWCTVAFFAASDVLAAVKWGISAGVLLLMAGMMKMSLMPVLQADRAICEVKRIELLLAKRG